MITLERYTQADEASWNDFVATSRNATFLHDRRYMDYHSDRFDDFSLMARDGHGRLLALLPACRDGAALYSHRGLTYGGWLLPARRGDALDMLGLFDAMRQCLSPQGITELHYKAIPHIYHRQPAEEDTYALFHAGAVIESVLISSVVSLPSPIPMDQGSRQRARKVLSDTAFTVGVSDDWTGFWRVLESLLRERYSTSPVHSLEEMELLRRRFRERIRLFTAVADGELLGGVVIYDTGTVAHSQYTAASPRGKELSVIPAIYSVIADYYRERDVRWLDFGTSNEDGGRRVNEGLLRQKCSYGGRGVAYTSYLLRF